MLAAIWFSIAIAALGVLDVGHFYFVRRDLQRAADLAATAAAQTIGSAGGCGAATASAKGSATANGLPSTGTVQVVCGRWDPSANSVSPYFSTTTTPLNAARVTVNRTVPYFFLVGPPLPMSAVATAQATNIRSFSLTTTVAALSGGALNGLLNGLLHTSLNLSVLSYQGLATAQVKLGDLAVALGAGTISQLLTTQVTVGQLAAALQVAANQGNTLSASVSSALGTIVAAIPAGTKISIGSMLSVGLGDPQAATTATVNVLDALMVAAEVANGQNAIDLGAALNLGPIANISAQAKIIEPPVIAVGEAGQNADGTWRTSAHSAKVRLYLQVNLLSLNLGIASVNAIHLPIYIEAAQSTAYLSSTQCSASKATSQSVITAQPGIAAICIGDDAANNLANVTVPATCNQPAHITSATVFGFSLIDIYAGSAGKGVQLYVQPPDPTSMTFNGISGDSDDYQSANSNAVGSVVGSVLSQVVTNLLPSLYLTVGGVNVGAVINATLQFLLTGVAALLNPILNSLDAILVPLLQLLGVQIGVSTVHDLGLACGQSQLVN
ncbi:TadG family pilus assembly protein [Paraburkholderia sp.]|uniref:TadG family pilus assembly protein n=1 Tax=Paraburkholderia sp. TaxID=1926495 RepID=UPI003D6E5AF0